MTAEKRLSSAGNGFWRFFYYTEDLPIAAYQPVVTNVLQPLEHAGEDGDTEAAGEPRARKLSRAQRRRQERARRRAGAEAEPLPATDDGDGD